MENAFPTLTEAYTLEEFKALIPEVDEVTAADLYDVFSWRTIPLNMFKTTIHMKMLLYADQYARMQRDEGVEYDAMVTDYMEALNETRHTGNSTGTEKAENSGTETTTGNSETDGTTTDNGTTTRKTDNTTTDNGTTSGTESTDRSTNSDTKTLEKTNPMQNTYAATSGSFPALAWDTSDTQSQTVADTSEKGTVTTSGTSGNTNKLDGTETTTENRNGTNGSTTKSTGSRTSSGSNNVTKESEDTSKDVHAEQRTGRSGRSPAELLMVSMDYIERTKSFKWLCRMINPCFIWSIDL